MYSSIEGLKILNTLIVPPPKNEDEQKPVKSRNVYYVELTTVL